MTALPASAVDLTTTYLGLRLHTPLVASAGPLTGHVETLRRLEEAGVGAVVLPSLFEEELEEESARLHETLSAGTDSFAEAPGGFFPDVDFSELGLDRHVRLVERARADLSVPVIASVNARTPGAWERYARQMVDAGADAIELNVYAVEADPGVDGRDVERRTVELVESVRAAVRGVPLAVKIGPFYTALAGFARELVTAGADGLVLFNRFYQPDLDPETLRVDPRISLSDSRDLRLPLRWVGILRPGLPEVSLALSSGVHSGLDAAKALLVGADVTMMTSGLLRHGPSHVATVEAELRAWLAAHEYESVEQLRGSVSRDTAADPGAFERANYVRVLSSYTL